MMGVYMTPWTERLLQLVKQAPRSYEWLFTEVSGLIPPGRAWREREKYRQETFNRNGYHRSREIDPDDAIRYGRRAVFYQSITRLVQRGRLVFYEQDGQRWVRYGRDREVPTEEEMHRRAMKGVATWKAKGAKRNIEYTPERRAKMKERVQAFWANMTPEERARRSQLAADLARSLSPELRHQRSLKSAATRRRLKEQRGG